MIDFISKTFLAIFFSMAGIYASATDNLGDYRSNATPGNWSAAATWERFDGATWVAAITAPTSTDGVITIRSPHIVTVNTAISADQVIVEVGGTLSVTSTLTIDDGTGTDLVVNGTLDLSGTLSGSGSVTVNGTMNWTGGTVSVTTTVSAAATLAMSGAVKTLGGSKTLTIQGTMNWSGGTLTFANGTLINEGLINVSSDVGFDIQSGGQTDLFSNTATGTFTKLVGTGTSSIGIPVTNAGTINLNTGTLSIGKSFTHTGTLTAASGTTLTLQNSSTFTDNGTININAATLSNGGTLHQNILISFTGSCIFNTSGTTNVNVAQTWPSTVTKNLSGTLGGSGSVIVNGTMNWTGGIVSVTTTISAAPATLAMSGGVKTLGGSKTLTMQGTMNWSGGDLTFANGTLINQGSINASSDNSFNIQSGGQTDLFNNTATGTFTKSAGTGTTSFGIPVTNAGTMKGIGTLLFNSTFTNNGTIAPGLSPGILTVNGTAPFSSNSILSIELKDGTGAGTGHDQLQRTGNVALTGTLNATEIGTVPNGSYTIISLTSGTISGSFATTNLPANYTLQVNASNVQLIKNTPLPLSLISFTALKTTDKKVNLQWITTEEYNVSHFEVQRCADGIIYTRIAIVQALNSPIGGTYNYKDETPLSKTNYYRLRMVDLDARFQISPVRKVVIDKENYSLSIYPNPAIDFVQIDFSSSEKKIQVSIFDAYGKLLLSKLMNNDLLIKISVAQLAAGSYYLRVSDGVQQAGAAFLKQ